MKILNKIFFITYGVMALSLAIFIVWLMTSGVYVELDDVFISISIFFCSTLVSWFLHYRARMIEPGKGYAAFLYASVAEFFVIISGAIIYLVYTAETGMIFGLPLAGYPIVWILKLSLGIRTLMSPKVEFKI